VTKPPNNRGKDTTPNPEETDERSADLNKFIQQWQDDSLVSVADCTPEDVPWIWKHRLPRGEVTVIDGDPGQGKSLLTIELASHVSTGTMWPDGSPCQCGVVLMLSAEDDPRRTIRPRLEAADAALGMVYVFKDQIDIDDIVRVRALADKYDALLVIIDPLMAYLGTGANSWKDQDMRKQLQPLQKMARDLDLAVVIVRHLNKGSGGKAIYRGQGSIGTIAAARMGWVVETDPDNPDLRVLACTKSNLGPEPSSLSYRLAQVPVKGLKEPVGRVEWMGTSGHGADALLAGKGKEMSAEAFLIEVLADGPMESRLILEAADARGVPKNAVWTAKRKLAIKASKDGYGAGSPWVWALPIPIDPHLQ
jgi:AAA domain